MSDEASEAEKGQLDYNFNMADEYVLNEVEKNFILAAERGDLAGVKRIIEDYKGDTQAFNLNCVDPLNRSALISAIENENFDLIVLLLGEGIDVGDALLHAISEEYVEAVEELLQWEETHHQEGQPYSWEAVDRSKSTFTPDITPLILAAHRNNYEILKVLLDRGATLPMPHDVKCGCDDCVTSQETDSLRHSQSRINAFRALSASSLIALSSRDPVLTAFELSWELKRLQAMESEFRAEYTVSQQEYLQTKKKGLFDVVTEMRLGVQEFVSSLLDHARTSMELEVMLNFNHEATHDVWMPGQRQTLERLKLAIKYKQKAFVAHPNVQQLLAAIWYEGLPGFRRKTVSQQIMDVVKLGCMFPLNSMNYLIAPDSDKGKFMRKPFVKFISHSCSYMFFLMLLGAASLRVVQIMFELVAFPWMTAMLEDWKKHERGSLPGPIELGIIMYIFSLIFGELRSLYSDGLFEYICDLWNIVDFVSNMFYVTWILCRATAWIIVHRDLWYRGIDPYFPREHWHPFDPMLLSEGAFAAGMIFSFLKLVHIFSINPHLGPLQVSLGRMIIDIIKFFFIYTLVLFAFGCGLNQLLWYYADLEKHKCYHLHPDVADFDDQEKACTIWRRFSNLFETSQSLFWASFGLVDLVSFDLAGIKSFTRFWALLMFGSYSVINIIVLLNMLIAMMSNSYQIISERADVEWKFARSQLWMSYFEDGGTVPPPFNLCPSVKLLKKTLGKETKKRTKSLMRRSMERAQALHDKVMKLLIRRFVTAEQRKRDDYGITEDDIIEVRQDISSMRFELLDIFQNNNFEVPDIDKKTTAGTRKGKIMERRIKKDFQIGLVETLAQEMNNDKTIDVFSSIAKVLGKRQSQTQKGEKKDWNAIVRRNTMSVDPIGSKRSSMQRRSQRSLRRQIIDEANEGLRMNQNRLVEFNPKLGDVTRATRVAYVKFMQKKLTAAEQEEDKDGSDDGASTAPKPADAAKPTEGIKKDDMTKSIKLLAAAAAKGAAPNPPTGDKPTEAPTGDKAAADKPADKPGDKPTAKPGDKPADKPGDKPTEKPGDKPADKPGDKPNDKPKPGDKPSDKPTPKPAPDVPKPTDKPAAPKPPDAAKPADKPAAGATPAPAAKPSDAAAKPDVAKPGEAAKPDAAAKKEETAKSDAAKPPEATAASAKGQAPAAPTEAAPAGTETTPATVPPEGAPQTTTAADKPAGAGDAAKSAEKPTDKPDDKPGDKPGDQPAAGGDKAAAAGDKPADKKPPPPKTNIKVGQSSAAAGGDRGKSTVTGRMISGWL